MDKLEKEIINEELLLRDYLAADRTMLAVDRTFLSYIRTSLTLFVAGISLIKFFDTALIHSMGWLFIISGIATFIFGLKRRIVVNKVINKQKAGTKVQKMQLMPSFTSFNLTSNLKHALDFVFRFLSAPTGHPKVKN